MGDKCIDDVKNNVTKEIQLLAKNTQQICKKAAPLREEAAELAKNKQPSADDKKRVVDLRKALDKLQLDYQSEADETSKRISKILQTKIPNDKDQVPDWQKDMAPWYRDLINKEPGLKLGKDLRLSGDISIKDKEATIILNGKF